MGAGGGFEPRLLLSNALHWAGRAAEADTELVALGAVARTDTERAQVAIPRMFTLAWLGRIVEVEALVQAVTSVVSDDTAALELAASWSVIDSFRGRTVQAAVIGSSWIRGLLLAGLLDQADHASRRYREHCHETPGPGDVITSAMCGAVATSRGQIKTAARWFRQSLAAGADTSVEAFTLMVDLPGALGMAGDATSARQALDELTAARNQGFVYLEPEVLLAPGVGGRAAEGSVSEAVTLARQAAELAASHPQPAVEVLALHTVVCFGDRTVADRLAALATQVDGPRAGAAAAHAAALAADEGTALLSASVQLEQLGLLLLAADAAAQASAAHLRHNQRGSGQAAAARAHRLAQACEGARTPALAALAAPLPLTTREREIVTLAAGGLSNRQIAQRLIVWPRLRLRFLLRWRRSTA